LSENNTVLAGGSQYFFVGQAVEKCPSAAVRYAGVQKVRLIPHNCAPLASERF
jgi:hypothetical protein